jgi:transposase-like protein
MDGLLARRFRDEEAARKHPEGLLWKDGLVFPHCGMTDEATKLNKNMLFDGHGRDGLHKCNGCGKQFTVTVGTIFEDSHNPLHKWLLAIHLMCSSKKGASALQIQRNLKLGSYRTAWFLCHRIRWGMRRGPVLQKLSGVVEADETYVGGKEKIKPVGLPGVESNRTAVLGLVEVAETFALSG